MMKRLLYSLLLTAAVNVSAFAQCTPGSSTSTTIPNGIEGSVYSESLTMAVPTDTTVNTGSFNVSGTINHAQILTVTGMPSGFTRVCNPVDCKVPGGTAGCILISGNPTTGDAGDYTITVTGNIETVALGNIINVPFSVDVAFTIDPLINSVEELTANAISIYPNPVSDKARLNVELNSAQKVDVRIYNAIGKTVMSKSFNAVKGANQLEIDADSFRNGIYFYQVRTATGTVSKSFVVR